MNPKPSRHPPHAGPPRRRAFTLIEILLVIGILSIVAALAAPRYASALDQYRADHTARRIATDIATLQATARATATSQTIVFNLTTNSYSVSSAGNNPLRVTLADAPFHAVLESATFGGTPTLTFNGFAVARQGGTVVVRSGATRKTVSVEALTGATTVQ